MSLFRRASSAVPALFLRADVAIFCVGRGAAEAVARGSRRGEACESGEAHSSLFMSPSGATADTATATEATAAGAQIPVCRPCGRCPRNETWHGFAFAYGIDMERVQPCTPNPELARDWAVLPVTHTTSGPDVYGTWFYYARGCSDLGWNAGRTLLATNRVQAALMLEARLQMREAWDHPRVLSALAARISKYAKHLRGSPWRTFGPGNTTANGKLLEVASRGSPSCGRQDRMRVHPLSHLAADLFLDNVMWEQARPRPA